MNDALTKLQSLLRELFQIEGAGDLDFGIYRIMGQKRSEVESFIDERLPEIVDEALQSGAVSRQAGRAEELRQKIEQVKENFGEYAITPQGDLKEGLHDYPLGKQYLALRLEAGDAPNQEQLKASIFNHLFTFFGRYYDGGDFLSRRRHSGRQKYAIRYNGEEVYLHWANADQYYVKTSEHFLDYSYTRNGITVRFEVVAADVEHNDVKDDNRRFVPRVREAAYDAETRTLTIPFEWRPLSIKEQNSIGKKQADVDGWAVKEIPGRFGMQPEELAVLEGDRRKYSKGEPVSHLGHHLRRYTARNTSDFFIHRDLEGFLEGELGGSQGRAVRADCGER
jgi:adenine-specific DNA-methyltransferase